MASTKTAPSFDEFQTVPTAAVYESDATPPDKFERERKAREEKRKLQIAARQRALNCLLDLDWSTGGEVVPALQNQVAASQEFAPSFQIQSFTEGFADGIERMVRHLDDVELIHNADGIGQHFQCCVPVGTPHIHRHNFDVVAIKAGMHPLHNGGFIPVRQDVHDGVHADVCEDAAGFPDQEQFINPKPFRGVRRVLGVQFGDVLVEDVPDGLLIDADVYGNFSEGPLQGSALNVLHQSPGHVALVIHVGERLEEGLLALQTLIPLALHHDPGTLAVDRRVHEPLPLNAVTLQRRVDDATPDADGGSGVVFGWNHDVVIVLLAGQRFPAVQAKQVRQENRITKPDCSVLTGGTV